MTIAYEIVEAKPWHCGAMSRMLRKEHDGAVAKLGFNSHRELRVAFDESVFRRSCLVDGKLIAIWGVTGPAISSAGLVWLAVSREIKKYPLALVKEVRQQIADMMITKRVLTAVMVEDDEVSKRFAIFLGFVPAVDDQFIFPANTRFGRKEVARMFEEGDSARVPLGTGHGRVMIYRQIEEA